MSASRKPVRDPEPTWWSDALLVGFGVVLVVSLVLAAVTCAVRCAS